MGIQQTPIRQQPLSQQIEKIIINRIQSGEYKPNTKLPPEDELASEFSVSRATIRNALNTLSALGLIVRRHGAGTFITQLPRISNPLDKSIDFQELIANYGYKPSFYQVYLGIDYASQQISKALKIPVESQVLVSHKVFKADGEPVIFCINTIPTNIFDQQVLESILSFSTLPEPIFNFIEDETGFQIEYFIAYIRAVNASNCCFRGSLPLPANSPILEIDEVAYTANGQPVFHTYEYHPQNKMSFELLRRRAHK